MKLLIILAVTTLCNGAKLDRTYLPPNAQNSGGSDFILQTPFSENSLQNQPSRNAAQNSFSRNNKQQFEASGFGPADKSYSSAINGIQNPQYNAGFNDLGGFEAKPERAQAALERNAAILRQNNENDGERYSYAYETENGIYAEENGVATNGNEAEGGFSYTGDDGKIYSIRYTADQNGFVPEGEHLPTPPPVPEEILKALEQNARDEAAGIYDDGSYSDAKYASEDVQGYDFNANNQYSSNNQAINDAVVVNSAGSSSGFSRSSANNVAQQFDRTTPIFGNGASAVNNVVPVFGKSAPSFGSNIPSSSISFANNAPSFGTNNPSFGNNSPSFANNIPSVNVPSFSTNSASLNTGTHFGRSQPSTSPVYGTSRSSSSLSRTAPTFDSNAPVFGQRTFGVSASSGSIRAEVEKAYLPPSQTTSSENSFGRRQSFSERNGYQY